MNNRIWLAAYGLASKLFVEIVGTLTGAEIIGAIGINIFNLKSIIYKNEPLKMVVKYLLLLLIFQIISDFINSSEFTNYIRGWMVIIICIISTIFLTKKLNNNSSNIIYYIIGLIASIIIFGDQQIEINNIQDNSNYFKNNLVGITNGIVILLTVWLTVRKKYYLIIASYIAYGILCIGLDARSNSVVYLLSGIFLNFKLRGRRFNKNGVLIGVFTLFVLYIFYLIYVDQVLYSNFGGTNSSSQLNKASNPYNPFELLYYGRADFVVLFQACMESPIFGHGSWAKDFGGNYATLTALISDSDQIDDFEYIRAHSIILGYWAYAGIGGFISLLLMYFNLYKYFFKMFNSSYFSNGFPVLILLTISMIWAFFFSPIGALRHEFPIFASLMIIEYNRFITIKND